MSTKDDIEKLASRVVEDSLADDCPAARRIDALKTLTPIYTILTKAKAPRDDEDGLTFEAFQEQIEEASSGETPVRTGRDRRAIAKQ